jgi:hypothetical protein
LSVSLRGTFVISPERDRSITCIASDGKAQPRNFLEGFLVAFALAAAEETRGAVFEAIAIGGAKDEKEPTKLVRRLKVPSPAGARAYLTALAEDLFARNNHYFLPLEAVEIVVKERHGKKPGDHRKIWEAIETIRDNDFYRCRSDYGPIRNPRDYSALPPAKVIDIVKRRFDPIIGIFGD